MDTGDWGSMSTTELWDLYDEVTVVLSRRMAAEKAKLEDRLRKIDGAESSARTTPVRRPYPPVLQKYRNPKNPAETWSGRGKQPRWLRAQLRSGKKLENFLIAGRPGRKRQ